MLKRLVDIAQTLVTRLGGFDELDPRSVHMIGMHGGAYANFVMKKLTL